MSFRDAKKDVTLRQHLEGEQQAQVRKILSDIMDAFFCIPLSEGFKKYTAFVTKDGLFEYNAGCFGLANMPEQFQPRIEDIFRTSVDDGWLKHYMDDLPLQDKDWEAHL